MSKENKIKNFLCWICGSEQITLVKESNIKTNLTSKSFAITDFNYGTTGNIYKCSNCGFLECPDIDGVLKFYEELEDTSYEEGRRERLIQMKWILKTIRKYKKSGRLLDIGAGSGLLIEEAIKAGFNAYGVEPSQWLYLKAKQNNLPVFLGTFPNKNLEGQFDIVTLIDVIEHISNPSALLKEIIKVIKNDGIIVVITPDVDSFVAKLLSWKWWHFRIAHIGYYNKFTMDKLFKQFNFKRIAFKRPAWFFPLNYLIKRLNIYLPPCLHIADLDLFKRFAIPLNLRDSMLVIYKKSERF